MLFHKIFQVIKIKVRAKTLRIKFNRVANFNLPNNLIVLEKRQKVNLPSKKGMDGEFIEVLLDDCYELKN